MPDLSQRTLDDLLELRSEKVIVGKDPSKPYVGLEHLAPGSSSLRGWQPGSASISTNSVFELGDVLFGKLRPNLRKCVRAQFAGYCSTDILVLRARPGVDSGYAFRVMHREETFAAAVNTAAGTKMPRTSWNELRTLNAFCPSDVEAQRRIAAVLDAADDAIAKTEAVIDKLQVGRLGTLDSLMTPAVRTGDPLAPGWCACVLGDLLDSTEYGISSSLTDRAGIPVLRMNNFSRGEAVLDEIRFATAFVPEGMLLRPGDVLFNRTNSYDHVGRTGIWRGQLDGATFASYLVRLNPKPSRLRNEYLNLLLNLRGSQLAMRQFATPAVAQVNINPTNLRRLPVTVPIDLHAQDAIIEAAGASRAAITSATADLDKLKAIKAGLASDLLTGSVPVSEGVSS